MEIIKNNFASEEKLIDVTCPYCESVLRCTEEEKRTQLCPVCGHNLYEEPRQELLYCEECDHDFYDSTPKGVGAYGVYYTTCPLCGNIVYYDDGIDVTADNLKLEYFSEPKKAKHVDFSDIKKFVQIGVDYLKDNPDENYHFSATGDSFVLVTRDDNEFYVMYTDNYRDVWVN